jgi:hypothetical protein
MSGGESSGGIFSRRLERLAAAVLIARVRSRGKENRGTAVAEMP